MLDTPLKEQMNNGTTRDGVTEGKFYLRALRWDWLPPSLQVLPAPDTTFNKGLFMQPSAFTSWVLRPASMPPTSDSATRNAWPSRPGSCWTDERLRLAPLLVTGLDCDTTAGGVSCFFLVNGRNAPVGRCFELKRSLEVSIEPFACAALVHSPCPHLSSGDKSFCSKESGNVDCQEICLFL